MRRAALALVALLALSACGGGDDLTAEERQMVEDMRSLDAEIDSIAASANAEADALAEPAPLIAPFGETLALSEGVTVTAEAPVEYEPGMIAYRITLTNDTPGILEPETEVNASAYSGGMDGSWVIPAEERYKGEPTSPPSRTMPGDSSTWWHCFHDVANPTDSALTISRGMFGELGEVTFMTKVPGE